MQQRNTIFQFDTHKKFPEMYQICKNTGTLKYLPAKVREYGDSYFAEEYQAQYQKTYYEDEPNIRNLAKKRLYQLSKYSQLPGKSLLEVGCASGFFLDEARKAGLEVQGIEPSPRESEYAQSLGLSVFQGSFFDFPMQQFDIVCAFFVLEHLPEQEEALYKLAKHLKPEGILYLALPSLAGPSFLTNATQWFASHPSDHFYDYHPVAIKKVLDALDIVAFSFQPMSYHKTRDQNWRGKLPDYFYKKLANYSCYGDTMQILAKKGGFFQHKFEKIET